MSRKRKSAKDNEVQVWINHSYDPNQEPWSIENIPHRKLTILRLMHTKNVKQEHLPNNNSKVVCYRGFKIRAWAIRTKPDGTRLINLYDESGKTVHWYELSNQDYLVQHSSRSPNHTNNQNRKKRQSK